MTDNQNSKESSEFSKLLMLRSSAEASIERYENRRRLCLLITVSALILHCARNIVMVLLGLLRRSF
jgi:hypothetical protein